ncbi:MAG: hypothetical protein ACK424_00505, partial [Candidatus Thermochlorobacter sp.]
TELSDVLTFNRLKGDIKKIFSSYRLVLVHGSIGKVDQVSQSVESLLTLNKTFAAKLSEELLPAVSLAAHHLGTATVDWLSVPQDIGASLVIKPHALSMILARGGLPVIAPIIKDGFDKDLITTSEWIAAKVAAAIQADLLIFLTDAKAAAAYALDAHTASTDEDAPPVRQCAKASLHAGAKRAFVTDISGMEKILIHQQTAPTEISVDNS